MAVVSGSDSMATSAVIIFVVLAMGIRACAFFSHSTPAPPSLAS